MKKNFRAIAEHAKRQEDLYYDIVNALNQAWFYEMKPGLVFKAIREGTTGPLASGYRGLKKPKRRSKRRSRR
jgi:hypothetical protein